MTITLNDLFETMREDIGSQAMEHGSCELSDLAVQAYIEREINSKSNYELLEELCFLEDELNDLGDWDDKINEN